LALDDRDMQLPDQLCNLTSDRSRREQAGFALAATVNLGSYRKQKQLLQQAATVASFVYRRQKSVDKPLAQPLLPHSS